jgi:hypothetical protein
MKEIFRKADECIDITSGNEVCASSGAEYPAVFLYVGEKAAKNRDTIKKTLRQKLVNGASIRHAVLCKKGGEAAFPDADLCIGLTLPENRGDCLNYILGDDSRLAEFNDAARRTADCLMMSSGFPQMSRGFLFIMTASDDPLNALLPEFVMLFSENAHIRVSTFLFVDLDSTPDRLLNSAAFFHELEDCQKSGFVYDSRIMLRGEQRISVRWEGAVFGAVFFLEMYRSDMKYSAHNEENNAKIAALTAVLEDRAAPVPLPASVFYTAGISSAQVPRSEIAHVICKSVVDMISGVSAKEGADMLPVREFLGYDAIARVCDRVMLTLPDVGGIVSAMPKVMGKDPDAVRNTNVRNILEYYGGGDEELFNARFAEKCANMIDCCDSPNVADIFKDYINKGRLRLCDIPAYLAIDGAVSVCLDEVSERLSSDEETLTTELDRLLSEPCPGLSHGLFSKPTGCEILAAAVSVKYGKKLEILRVKMMKRLVSNLRSRIKEYDGAVSSAAAAAKALSDELSGELLRELYNNGSTLTDASVFTGHYAAVTARAAEEYDRSGSMAAVLKDRDLYTTLMSITDKGTGELTDIALGIYRKLIADPGIRAVFAMNFDEELYARYKDADGGKDPGWVDARLIEKLTEESRANLRYSVFQPSNSLYCMGNGNIGFVKKMSVFEDPAFSTVFVGDIGSASYEQLAVYNVPSPDSVVYINECRKAYDEYVSGGTDAVFIGRGAEGASV